ncbi:MAG TPA: rRNA maturation RNase YbeY [Candidatus Azoamicus sp.]
MKINIINKIPGKIKKNIINITKYILKNKKNKIINIKITHEMYIKVLNKKYRGKNKSTDVLTFKTNYAEKNNEIGNIILCPKIMLKKQKQNYWGKTIIHCMLHILDYDHIEKSDFRIMSQIEKKIGMSGIEPPTITTSK